MRIITALLIIAWVPSFGQVNVEQVSFRKDTVNIVQYGAKADGMTLNTKSIQTAIDELHKKGGGTVVVPSGVWVTGPIKLRSHINLHVSGGALLQFTDDFDQYPLIKTNWEGLDAIRAHAPIYGADLENIGITGKGVIDGAGHAWRPVKKNKMTPPEWKALTASGGYVNEKGDIWYPTKRALEGSTRNRPGVIAEGYDFEKAEAIKEFLRPNMVTLIRCRKVLLEGVTFQNSPAWCLHPLMTRHLTVRGIWVRNPWYAQNGDGIDVESCRYVLIEDSHFDVGDDAICLKSGRDEEGRKRGIPTEDVIVRNCVVYHGHGGFVVGSEMSGGVRNVYLSDCTFSGTDIGIRFKTTRGRGGIVENIHIENIRMNNIGGAAILFDMYYMAKDPLALFAGESNPVIAFEPVSEATPQFRDINIKGVTCKGAETGIFVRGLPEMNIRNIRMEDIHISSKEGFVCVEGDGISLVNASLHSEEETAVQIQNSRNIVLDNVSISKDVETFLQVSGDRTRNVQIRNMGPETKPVTLSPNVPKDVIVYE